jgi:hypothetical protein
LNGFYSQAQALLHEKIAAADFSDWARREGEFAHRATSWIQTNMGGAALAKFQDMNGPSYDFAPLATSAEHAGALNWLNKVLANLQELRRDPGWDANAPSKP